MYTHKLQPTSRAHYLCDERLCCKLDFIAAAMMDCLANGVPGQCLGVTGKSGLRNLINPFISLMRRNMCNQSTYFLMDELIIFSLTNHSLLLYVGNRCHCCVSVVSDFLR